MAQLLQPQRSYKWKYQTSTHVNILKTALVVKKILKLLKKFNAFNVKISYMTIETIPFIPNVAWCIKPSEDSWHLVNPINNLTDFNRDSLMMRYYSI